MLTPLLVGSLGAGGDPGRAVVIDGESNWLEGLALVGLYIIIAASVWYGPVISP